MTRLKLVVDRRRMSFAVPNCAKGVPAGKGSASPDLVPHTASLTAGTLNRVSEEMSYKMIAAVLLHDIPAKEKHILTVLAYHANDRQIAWPRVSLIAKECGVSERHVQRMLKRLLERGLIVSNIRHARTTEYKIVTDDGDNNVGIDGDIAVTHNERLNATEENPREFTAYEQYQRGRVDFVPVAKKRGAK